MSVPGFEELWFWAAKNEPREAESVLRGDIKDKREKEDGKKEALIFTSTG